MTTPHILPLALTIATVTSLDNKSPKPKPNLAINSKSLLPLLNDYTTLTLSKFKQIHCRMLRLNLLSHPYSASKLLSAISLSPFHNLTYALHLFDQIPQPNLFSYNTLIRAYSSSSSSPSLALLLFLRLLSHSPHAPDNFTFPFALKAAAKLSALPFGSALHAMIAKSPDCCSDIYILNSLISFYASCGDLNLSMRVFEKVVCKDVVSWNSIIAGFVQAGRWEEALELFWEMEKGGFRANDVTLVNVISACGMKGDLEFGRWVHNSYVVGSDNVGRSLLLDNAVLDMYVKCGGVKEAKLLFEGMADRDSVSWTIMLVGCVKAGDFDDAKRVFDEMPDRDVAAWNALISGYEQTGKPKDALTLFNEMQNTDIEPDPVTLVAALSACAQLGAVEKGSWIHAFIKKNSFALNYRLTTALIDMYSNCGELEKAVEVFASVDDRDVYVWSAMIAGFAMYGRGRDALDLFMQMQEAQVKPNKVTFISVLSACSHAGLVEEGRTYFAEMLPVYGIAPDVEHYGCMVDMFGRAGLLDDARDLSWVGSELASKHLVELGSRNDGGYILLSNLYAKSGKLDKVAKLRNLMKDRGLKEEPGCSSTEVHGILHEF